MIYYYIIVHTLRGVSITTNIGLEEIMLYKNAICKKEMELLASYLKLKYKLKYFNTTI